MTKRDWIKNKLVEIEYNKIALTKLYETFKEETRSNWSLESYKREIRLAYTELMNSEEYVDLSKQVINFEAQKQKFADLNNSLRKNNRETFRVYNSLQEVYTEYVNVLKEVDLSKINITPHKTSNNGKIGIFQLSDNHLNEIIYECESHGNTFDFYIASKRLKKFVSEAIKLFDLYSIKDCYIIFSGDLINSNRRLSERLAQNTSLVRASLLATYLYQQVIIELSHHYNIHIAGVVGNESRLEEYMDSSDILASENWDYLIYHNLRMMFRDKPIEFIDIANPIQGIVTLKNGFNILVTHGHTFKSAQTIDKNIASMLQNYIYKGIKINMVLMGHYHSSAVGDFISRSGSLCGANSYSSIDLQFISRASQNIYIVNEDFSYTGIKIDLQNTDNVKGYDIIEDLERYNASAKTSNSKVTITSLV